jgi:hypothetical protein
MTDDQIARDTDSPETPAANAGLPRREGRGPRQVLRRTVMSRTSAMLEAVAAAALLLDLDTS